MKKLAIATGCVFLGLTGVVLISSRTLGELTGYLEATADETVTQLEANIPDSVRDRKFRNNLDEARGAVIDQRVSLNLAVSQIEQMKQEIASLESAIGRRNEILSKAYPALQSAAEHRTVPVSFAGRKWAPSELELEVDRLMSEQDRDEGQLAIRREALGRLEISVQEGARALAQMDDRLLETEADFDALVIRRQQAATESDLLDLIASVGRGGGSATSEIADNIERLRSDVGELEARNDARRDTVSPADRSPSRLTQAWERLERLRRLHEESADDAQAADNGGGPDGEAI